MLWSQFGTIVRAANVWGRRSKTGKAVVSIAELLTKLTIFIGVLNYLVEGPERARQRHYQAWQLINGSGKSRGEAGRSIAIGVLVDDHIEMPDLDLTGGNFHDKNFQGAKMPGVDFTGATIDHANFSCKAGFFVSDEWFPPYSRCWETNLENASFVTMKISQNKFYHSNLKYAQFGGTPQGASWRTSVESSCFVGADMYRVTIRDAFLTNNIFDYAKLQKSEWQRSTIGSNNSFVGAHLNQSRWYGLRFFKEGLGTDFTDADLSAIVVSDPSDPCPEHVLTEGDELLHRAKLCRTKFSDGVSNRDCPVDEIRDEHEKCPE